MADPHGPLEESDLAQLRCFARGSLLALLPSAQDSLSCVQRAGAFCLSAALPAAWFGIPGESQPDLQNSLSWVLFNTTHSNLMVQASFFVSYLNYYLFKTLNKTVESQNYVTRKLRK